MTSDAGARFSQSDGDRLAQPCRRSGYQSDSPIKLEPIENHESSYDSTIFDLLPIRCHLDRNRAAR